MKPLIAIVSCHRNWAKREAQRATWVHAVKHIVDVKFFLGKRPDKIISTPDDAFSQPLEDEIWFDDCPDDYYGIPLKVQRICGYTVLNNYPYVAKVDDDVYMVPGRLLSIPYTGYDYVGRFRGPYGNYPAFYASGFTYWLSQRSAAYVAGAKWNRDWIDERFVANTLAFWKIYGYNDPRNYIVSGPHIQPNEVPKRAIIRDGAVFCEYYPKQMYEMHEVFATAGPVSGHPGLEQVKRVEVTEEMLYAPPADAPPPEKVNRR